MVLTNLAPVKYGSLFFAPMEGITDEAFRKTIQNLYPEWDYLACDFLRVPSAGRYPTKHLIRHFGKDLFENQEIKNKTLYQILTSHKAFTQEMISQLNDLDIPWVDINLGCPSMTVCKNGGGSYLLKDLLSLRPLVKTIRENFKGRLTAKIRSGFSDTHQLEDSVRLLNDEGIEYITVHGRTREQMYKEPADWSLIKRAAAVSKVPIIGNGDVWSAADIDRMLETTGCHAVMVARGALKFPWMARDYKNKKFIQNDGERIQDIKKFFEAYKEPLITESITPRGLLKQSKSVSRFMLEGLENGDMMRRRLILSQTPPEFFSILDQF